MLGEIIEIKENIVIVKCQNINTYNNIMNNYVLLRDTKNIIGEIISIQGENIYIIYLEKLKIIVLFLELQLNLVLKVMFN